MTKFGYLSVPVILFAMAFSANAQDGKNLGTNADRSQDVLDVDVWLDGQVGYAYSDNDARTGGDGVFYQNTWLGFNVGFNDSISATISLGSGYSYSDGEDAQFGPGGATSESGGGAVTFSHASDGLNFDLYNLSFADAFTEGLTVTFGSTERSFGLDSNNLWYNPRRQGASAGGSFGGFRQTGLFLDYGSDNMSVGFGWAKVLDTASESTDLSHVLLDLTYGLDSVSEGSAIAFGILYENVTGTDTATTIMIDSHWAGLVEGLTIGFGVGFNTGEIAGGDIDGMRIALNLTYDLGMDNGAWVGAKFDLSTGPDDGSGWHGYNSKTGAMALNVIEEYDLGGSGLNSNLSVIAFGGGMSFDMGSGKNNAAVSLLIGLADQDEGDDAYGTEVDVNFDHTLNSNVAWGCHLGYVTGADEGTFGNSSGDDSSYLITFPVNFSF